MIVLRSLETRVEVKGCRNRLKAAWLLLWQGHFIMTNTEATSGVTLTREQYEARLREKTL